MSSNIQVLIVLVTSSPVPQETPGNDNDYVDAVVVTANKNGDDEVTTVTKDTDSATKPMEALGGLMKGLFDLIRGSLSVIQGAAKNIQKVSEDPVSFP